MFPLALLASVSGPDYNGTGQYTITWTNSTTSPCSVPYYKIRTFKDGVEKDSVYI